MLNHPLFILCDFHFISTHCFLFSYLFCYIHDQNFARGYPLFSFLSCLRQNQNQHDRSKGEHPAGARFFSSNEQTTATTHTNPGRQFSAGLGTGQYGKSLNQGWQIERFTLANIVHDAFV